ncbi:MAG: restriction endonuclease subunit S, partial [Tetragenococcus koreensis]|nr:restriction endonuclease subunit S [Tetragenococcus koreensis]
MSKEEKRAPEVRFEGFHDDWKQRKLGESLSILKDGTHGTHKNVENGPHLLSAKNIKNGKIKVTEDDRKISQKEYEQIHKNFQLKSGDILLTIVGSIGEAAVLQDPTGITFQRSVAYLRSSEIDTYFLYTLFIGPDFQKELKNRQVVSAQPGIYLGDISKIIVKIPKGMKEQKQIGKFFKQLNNAIALHQEKLSKLQSLKKAALQSLFPQKDETEPKVRFANFKSKWSQRQLGETLIERNIQQTQSIEYPLVSFTVQDGVTPKTERYNRQQLVRGSKKDKKYKVTEFNDIVYNPANL